MLTLLSNSSWVFVDGLSLYYTADDIMDLFARFGTVRTVRLKLDAMGMSLRARILRWQLMLTRSVPFYWQMRQVELCKQYTPSRRPSIPPRESRDLQDASLGRLVRTNGPLFFFSK